MFDNAPAVRPVLYVEDCESDAFLLRRALAKIRSPLLLQVIGDGERAWQYLSGQGPTSRPTMPLLILLDLKLPRKSGLEILASLKAHDVLRKIPVIVLTSSSDPGEIERAYVLGADFCLLKRPRFEGYVQLARAIEAYWLAVRDGAEAHGADPTLHRLRKLAQTAGPIPLTASGGA